MGYLEGLDRDSCPFCHRHLNDRCLEIIEGLQTISIDVPLDLITGELYIAVEELRMVVRHLNKKSKRRVKLEIVDAEQI